MQWLVDSYTVQAADIVPAWFGRGYNVGVGRWEHLLGANMTPSRLNPRLRLRSMDMTVHDSGGHIKDGLWVIGFVIGDPQHTGYAVPWFQRIQSKGRLIQWNGDQPMLCGFAYRIHTGGVAAGDYIDMGVGYELEGGQDVR